MTINTILVKICRLFLAATFIISAVAKIYSMHFFDGLVAGQLIGDDFYNHPTAYFWVQILTRVIIAGEFMLGIAVLQKKYLKNLVLPVMGFLLVIFSLQIVYEASFNGKGYIDGNCGCFGEVIPFDNLQTIIKNVVLLALVFFVYKNYKDRRDMAFGPVVPTIMVGLFTFFTMYLTVEPSNDENPVVIESPMGNSILEVGDSLDVSSKTVLDFSSDFKVGSTGSELVLTNTSVVRNTDQNPEMWFLLPGSETEKVSVSPGEKVKVKYKSKGVFDVSLVMIEKDRTDTLTKKSFFNIQASEADRAVLAEKEALKAQQLALAQKKKEEELKKKKEKEAVASSSSIFAPYRTGWSDGKYKDLDKGTHLICMFSLTCGHCQEAYRDILKARAQNAVAQPYILAYGGEHDLRPFWRKTGSKSPYILIKKYAQFASLLQGGGFPRIIVVENGKAVKSWDAESYSTESFNDYFGLSKPKEVPRSDEILLDDNSIPSLDLGSGQGSTIELE